MNDKIQGCLKALGDRKVAFNPQGTLTDDQYAAYLQELVDKTGSKGADDKPKESTGKVYLSSSPNRWLGTDTQPIQFRPDTGRAPTRTYPRGLGRLNSGDKMLQKRTGLTAAQIEARIEGEQGFLYAQDKDGQPDKSKPVYLPGQSSIWLEEQMVLVQGKSTVSELKKSLTALGEDSLRKQLADAKIAAPVKASVAELVTLVMRGIAEGKIE